MMGDGDCQITPAVPGIEQSVGVVLIFAGKEHQEPAAYLRVDSVHQVGNTEEAKKAGNTQQGDDCIFVGRLSVEH